MIQIDKMIFKGTWKESIGTNIFFKKGPDFNPQKEFVGHTTKIIKFHRVILKSKENNIEKNEEDVDVQES